MVVARGELHALRGHVTLRYGDANRVSAVVQGTRPYDVGLRYVRRTRIPGGALEVSCTCSHAAHRLCKHVWAALRVAERRGHLVSATRERGELQIIAARPEDGERPPATQLRWLIDLPRSSPYSGPTIDGYERALTLVGSAPRLDRAGRGSVSFGYVQGEALRERILDLAQGRRTDVLFDEERPPEPLVFDDGGSFRVVLVVHEGSPGALAMNDLVVRGELRRGDEVIALQELSGIFNAGLAFLGPRAVLVERDAPMRWVTVVQQRGELLVPADEAHRFLRELVMKSRRTHFVLPEAFELQEGALARTHVHVKRPDVESTKPGRALHADVFFDYGRGAMAAWTDAGSLVVEGTSRRIVVRDRYAENAAVAQLVTAGFGVVRTRRERGAFKIKPARLTAAILALPAEGFQVEAQGVVHRAASRTSLRVRTNIDWFDVHATVQFEGLSVGTPALLEAARRGEDLVRLGDGSVGVLPAEWLARVAGMIELATPRIAVVDAERAEREHDHEAEVQLRFSRTQLSLVDAMLGEAGNDVSWEGPLATLRNQLAGFADLPPADAPDGFRGQLRDYQRAGVAWMQWLETVGFSGCLADDMGLGKTVQVLALLARRKQKPPGDGESRTTLVVVPRSLVYNWIDEAARFAPALRLRELTSDTSVEDALQCDVVVATYGVLRRRVEELAKVSFDYVVLDEAHAVKNAETTTARAACRLRSRHRLALSGTPIENHLGELASLFDFLNPGMLGASVRGAAKHSFELDPRFTSQLGRGLRPFVLRRRKSDVLAELPPRVDQRVVCVMEPWQRAIYDRVKSYYQATLREQMDAEGLGASRLHVFEALLRLRQIACHPGLVDPELQRERSAKVDALLERLEPIVREGKKALVFSQFTSLLDIVGRELDARSIGYARLDGSSTNRRELVERFQTAPECGVFLVSLKAGGVGLNLTAAEYVFILDPWWNPAAEQQAVDRAHRMGQARSVMAYRLVCKDSVEERVAELQEKKRALIASIFDEAEAPRLGTLSAEDVEALLS